MDITFSNFLNTINILPWYIYFVIFLIVTVSKFFLRRKIISEASITQSGNVYNYSPITNTINNNYIPSSSSFFITLATIVQTASALLTIITYFSKI